MSLITIRTPSCPVCVDSSILAVDREKYDRWRAGEHIQHVWPDWTPGQRELLISGTHSDCWVQLFGPDED